MKTVSLISQQAGEERAMHEIKRSRPSNQGVQFWITGTFSFAQIIFIACYVIISQAISISGLSTPVIARDIHSLRNWALLRGMYLSESLSFVQSSDYDFSVHLKEKLHENSTVMSIPEHLAWKASEVLQELLNETPKSDKLQHTLQQFDECGMGNHKAEFLLLLKLFKESANLDSVWRPWLESLPKVFSTGISMTSLEKDCLPPFSRALAEYETLKLKRFEQAFMELTEIFPWISESHVDLKWAYNVIYTRCWNGSDEAGDKGSLDTEIVPMGDMFNHREPSNAFVRHINGAVEIVYQPTSNRTSFNQQLPVEDICISYGRATNAHRFLILFGFVDETMSEVFCEMVFPNPSAQHKALGCEDRSKMVFRTSDGAIANAVWDSILYALLASKPDEQDNLYKAHIQDNYDAKAMLHDKYSHYTGAILKNHLQSTLTVLSELRKRIQKAQSSIAHPNLALIHRQNIFLTDVFSKVKARIENR
jgi:hypothetical protein